MICRNCQTSNRDIAKYCKECGHLLAANCPNCGSELPDAAKYCDICGHHLASPLIVRQARQTSVTDSAAVPARQEQPQPRSRPQSHLHQYIPEELLAKLEVAQDSGGMLGERRIVTMLFCDVKGSTSAAEQLDPEEWSEIINGAFEHMISPVYRYEGTVARLQGDGILAFFGAPIAHEDDAARALLAGLDIISGIEGYRRQVRQRYEMEFDVRVGINTGRVVVGSVGSDLRLEYTALGDAVNVAARMEQTATPGTVQIAEDTHKLVAPFFDFEALGAVDVKGKKEPVTAYRVIGRKVEAVRSRGIGGLEAPLVGRDDEKAMLEGALDDLRQGRGRIVFLVGHAGLGKSRLIRELHALWQGDESARETLHFWLHRPVASYQASEAYAVFKNQIRLMYGIKEGSSPEEMRARLKTGMADMPLSEQASVYEPLARLLGIQETAGKESLVDGESFKRHLFAASLSSTRAMITSKPSVLVLDDLHWADPVSVEVIQYLFQLVDSVPILFLCASRPDRNAAGWTLKLEAEEEYPHRYRETVLHPLSQDDSLAMLGGLLTGLVWPESLKALILEKSDGNPFFIEEVVRALIEDGVVKRSADNGHWLVAAKVEDFVVPGNLQALLAARIDRLGDQDRQVLQLAAVIGRTFSYDVLQRISERSADLDRSLATLQRSDLIVEQATLPTRLFRFRNTLAQETVYRSILRKLRREYHRRVGEALMQIDASQLDEQLPALAHHFYHAEDERALTYNSQAGEASFKLNANQEAAAYFGRAIEIALRFSAGSSDELTYLYERRGRALELASQFAEALTNYREMTKIAKERQDQAMELASLVSAGTIYSTANDRFNPAKAEQVADQALLLAQQFEDHAAEAKILWNLLNMYRLSDRISQALTAGERSMELSRQYGLREQLAFSANDMTHVYVASGYLQKARETVQEAIQLWRELGNQPMLADSLATAAMGFGMDGDFERAAAMSDESFSISQSIGNLWGQSYSRFYMGSLYWLRGEADQAIETMQECVRLGKEAGFMPAVLYIGAHVAYVCAQLGAIEQALPLARASVAQTWDKIPYYAPFALTVLGETLLLAGELEEATAIYDELSAIETYAELLLEASAEEFKCRFNLIQGNYREALKNAEVLLNILAKRQSRVLVPGAQQLYAKALAGSGQPDLAHQSLADARTEAERLGLGWPLWQILVTSASLEATQGNQDEAENLSGQAAEILEKILALSPLPERWNSFREHPYWDYSAL